MRLSLCAAAIAGALLLPVAAIAQQAAGQQDKAKLVFLKIPDSLKDTEVHIAKILLERLKVNSSLQIRGDNADDLVLRVRFNANEKQNLPAMAAIVDTRILNRDKEGKPVSQVISIASFADIKVKADKAAALLEWANNLNRRTIPLRIYISGDKIVAGRNLLNARNAPLPENAITNAFTDVMRSWTTLLADLKKNGLIEQ